MIWKVRDSIWSESFTVLVKKEEANLMKVVNKT